MKPRSTLHTARRWRRPHCAATRLRARVIQGALALAALAIMANGADWILTDQSAAANELAMASSVIDVVADDTPAPNACAVTDVGRAP